jgi:nicotinate phosphoribosyltransferase
MAFSSELEAFQAYYKSFPESTILLVDTYNVKNGVKNAILTGDGIKGIRIDSGNLAEESKVARELLDQAGKTDVKIVVSGDLNEYKIAELIRQKAPIDSFGVGTQMVTSHDAPSLGGIYKLVEIERDGKLTGVIKLSQRKKTYPGKKQIFRIIENGKAVRDIIARDFEKLNGETLLHPYIKNGHLVKEIESTEEARNYYFERIRLFETEMLHIDQCCYDYPVVRSEELERYFKEVRKENTTE